MNAFPMIAPDMAPIKRRLTVARIQQVVTEYYGLDRLDMVSSGRHPLVSHPRQEAMYLARELTPMSLPDIGRRFGGRDHSTVIHACRQVAARIVTNTAKAHDISALLEALLPSGERR